MRARANLMLFLVTIVFPCPLLVLGCAKSGSDAPGGRVATARAGAFELRAEPVVLLEGGPAVVRLTLTHTGTGKTQVELRPGTREGVVVQVVPPQSWGARRVPRLRDGTFIGMVDGSGNVIGHEVVDSGETLEHVLHLHQEFDVVAGEARIKLTWPLEVPVYTRRADGVESQTGWRTILTPTVSLTLDIPHASAERRAKVVQDWTGFLDRPTLAPRIEDSIANQVLGTSHREFVPVALRLLQCKQHRKLFDLREYLYSRSAESPEVRSELLNYLGKEGGREDHYFFIQWSKDRIPATEEEVNLLLTSRSVWIRAYTYRTWPNKCPEGTKEALLTESAELRTVLESRDW